VENSQVYRDAHAKGGGTFIHSAREMLTIAVAMDKVFSDPKGAASPGLVHALEIWIRRMRCLEEHHLAVRARMAAGGKHKDKGGRRDWRVALHLESMMARGEMPTTETKELEEANKAANMRDKVQSRSGNRDKHKSDSDAN